MNNNSIQILRSIGSGLLIDDYTLPYGTPLIYGVKDYNNRDEINSLCDTTGLYVGDSSNNPVKIKREDYYLDSYTINSESIFYNNDMIGIMPINIPAFFNVVKNYNIAGYYEYKFRHHMMNYQKFELQPRQAGNSYGLPFIIAGFTPNFDGDPYVLARYDELGVIFEPPWFYIDGITNNKNNWLVYVAKDKHFPIDLNEVWNMMYVMKYLYKSNQ